MHFTEGRINRFLNDIAELICTEKLKITDIQIRYGEICKNIDLDSIEDYWQEYIPGAPWTSSSADAYALFKFRVKIPDGFDGEKVVLNIKTNRNGWNALNPQMLIYVDGKEYQGLDTNHTEVLLDDCAKKGKVYKIYIYAFSGITGNLYNIKENETEVRLYAELRTIHPLIEEFYYNLMVPHQLLSQLPESSTEHIKVLNILNDTINRVDMRIACSKEFYLSLGEANNYIKEQIYSKTEGLDVVITCIGHTHIDIAWLWRYCHTREKAARSFSTALKLMEQYPEYIFMSSQPQLYEYVKEDYPQVYERIKQRVREGRWEPEGGMWIESDTNVPSGESLVRQFLYGKRFFKEEFDVDNKILWLPDVFGYSGNLPQIMKKSGIDYFMTSKLLWNEFNKFPYHTFLWKGIDGSEVLAHLIVYSAQGYVGKADAVDIVKGWENYNHKDMNNDIVLLYGYGDGGGGPTKEMLESVRRYNNGLPGSPKTKTGSALEFFEKLDKRVKNSRRLPKWVGELYFENHRGTYTSMARNKKYNRKAEFLYASAEWISSFNHLLFNVQYPSEMLNTGWKSILLNQFHDVLPGSSIKEVYQDTDLIYAGVFKKGNRILEDGLDRIAASVQSGASTLVVFNPLSWERNALVEFTYRQDKAPGQLESEGGNVIRCQKKSEGKNVYIASVKGVLPKGYSSFKIIETDEKLKANENNIYISSLLLENAFFKICLDEKGHLTSIFDKRAGREVLKPGEKGNVLQAFEDKPRSEDNWNLDIYYNEKVWDIDDVASVETVENGPVRGILRIKRHFLNSCITQDIVLYNDIPRIDFKTVVDWREKDIVVKAAFPVDINSDRATYEIQYGHIERNTHWNTTWDIAKFEVCGHKWADLSEDRYGVSLLNDCKYGYDIKEGRMRLTLLRCGTVPNPDADKEIHEFTYSLYPHIGGWREGRTVQEAYDLNCPLIVKVIGQQDGNLPESISMIGLNQENVIVEAVKKSEDGNETIIRIYEAYNRRTDVKVRLCKDIGNITECDLMEKEIKQDISSIYFNGNEFLFSIKPLEIKTFKVRFKCTGED